jgi:antitoxin (DNA-binding transcriptional repressor) of toxin-antitoxin stability system
MKLVSLDRVTLDTCVREAQRERVVVTRKGKPVALIVGVEGMDEEQLQLGASDKFWKLIAERRTQKAMSRAELEPKTNPKNRSKSRRSKITKRS